MDFFTRFSSQQWTTSRYVFIHNGILNTIFVSTIISITLFFLNSGLIHAMIASTMVSIKLCFPQQWIPSRYFSLSYGRHHAVFHNDGLHQPISFFKQWSPSRYVSLGSGLHQSMFSTKMTSIMLYFKNDPDYGILIIMLYIRYPVELISNSW